MSPQKRNTWPVDLQWIVGNVGNWFWKWKEDASNKKGDNSVLLHPFWYFVYKLAVMSRTETQNMTPTLPTMQPNHWLTYLWGRLLSSEATKCSRTSFDALHYTDCFSLYMKILIYYMFLMSLNTRWEAALTWSNLCEKILSCITYRGSFSISFKAWNLLSKR